MEKKSGKEKEDFSEGTKKRIDELPPHAQEIFKKAHSSALEHTKIRIKEEAENKRAKKKLHIKSLVCS